MTGIFYSIVLFSILIGVPALNICADDDNTIAHWAFKNGAGNIIQDVSGNGHHGTIFGATWTDSSLFFDGIDDYVAVEDDPAFELDGDWTIEYEVLFSINKRSSHNNVVFSRTIDGRADYAVGSSYLFGGYGHSELYIQSLPNDTLHFRTPEYFSIRPYRVSLVKSGEWIYLFHDLKLLSRKKTTAVPLNGGGKIRIGAWGCGSSDTCHNKHFFYTHLQDLHVSNVARYAPPMQHVNGLVARWSFEEVNGNVVIDKSGNGHDGIITGALRTDGIAGASLTFSDSSQIVIKRHAQFNIDSTLTIVAWIRPYNLGFRRTIIHRNFTARGYCLGVYDGKLTAYCGPYTLTCDSLLRIDSWHQVALTCDGDSVRLFLNGKGVSSCLQMELLGFYDTTLSIGKTHDNQVKDYFQGSIDEISIFDIALSPDSIQKLYTQIISAAQPDTSAPCVIVTREEYKSVLQGRTYYEFGAQAFDGNDGDISDSVLIDNPLNVAVPGVYKIIYSVRNSIGKKGSAVRLFTVFPDTLYPVITLKGDSVVNVALMGTYKEPGYTAMDLPNGQKLTDSVKVMSDFDSSKIGTYTITYSVTDPAGLTTSVVRTVKVTEMPFMGKIRINQIGYYSSEKKIAAVADCDFDTFKIVLHETDSVLYTGVLTAPLTYSSSGEKVRIADFSPLSGKGEYVIRIKGFGHSHPFHISGSVYHLPLHAALKTFYFQRSSTSIEERYGGVYARAAGHPDTACPFYGNASQVKSVSGGWYDAGDYGKYVVNGGITAATLLSLYELKPEYFDDYTLNIPESGNGKSDLLDEIKWELDWFKTMQDSTGGVAFKVGPIDAFPPFVMPSEDQGKRYVIGMSTTSTLNFAAVMAQAGRVYRNYDSAYASDCLIRAEKAWQWAKDNPSVGAPGQGAGTGLYSDVSFADEFLWAAAELYIATLKDTFYSYLDKNVRPYILQGPASWDKVTNLPIQSLAFVHHNLNKAVTERAATEIVRFSQQILKEINASPYRIPTIDFDWGSNGYAANYAVTLGYAFYLTKDTTYLDGIISTLDYLCGKNSTAFSFITGFGDKTPMHPHHRMSGSDNVTDPVPGFIVGGPNRFHNDTKDGVVYPFGSPAMSYVDVQKSYASNEVAINWTAPFIFAAALTESECATEIPVSNKSGIKNVPFVLPLIDIVSISSNIILNLNLNSTSIIGWQLVNMMGRCIMKQEYIQKAGMHRIKLPLKSVPNGVYILRIRVENKQFFKRVHILR